MTSPTRSSPRRMSTGGRSGPGICRAIAWMTESRGDVPLRCNVSSARDSKPKRYSDRGDVSPLDPRIVEAQACPYGRALDSALLFCHSRSGRDSENKEIAMGARSRSVFLAWLAPAVLLGGVFAVVQAQNAGAPAKA